MQATGDAPRTPRVRARIRGRRPDAADTRVIAFSTIAATMTMFGQTPGVAVFVAAIVGGLELPRGDVSFAYALATFLSAFALPWIGRQMDLRGVGPTTVALTLAYAASFAVLAAAQGVAWLVVGFFGIRLLGPGALGLASRNAVSLQFRVHLGRAVAISGSLAAILSALVPFVLAIAIAAFGFRATWAATAVCVLVVLLPAVRLLPRGTERGRVRVAHEPGAVLDTSRAQALRSPMFWLITGASSVSAVILTGFAFHQVDILGEAGHSAEAAAVNFVPMTIASISFLALVAPLAGRWSSRRLLVASMAPLLVAMLLVPFLATALVPLLYMSCLGASLGAQQVLDGILIPRHFGVAAIGAIRGVAFTVIASASAAGPLVVGWLHDLTGGYPAVALALATLPVGVVVAAFLIRPRVDAGARRA